MQRNIFPFSRGKATDHPPVVVMHGSLDFHHLGNIAFDAIRYVTRMRPETVFRFVGQRTGALEKFLGRARLGIPGFHYESTGFVPYAEVAGHLADASVGIVPYEESTGTHCAFVAKVVEYVASGLPTVSTPLQSIGRYFKNDPMVSFAEFDGADFGTKNRQLARRPGPVLADPGRPVRRARPGRTGLAAVVPPGGGFCRRHLCAFPQMTHRVVCSNRTGRNWRPLPPTRPG